MYMYTSRETRGRKKEGEESKGSWSKFSERYGLLKKKGGNKMKKRTIIWETANTRYTGICREPRAVCHASWFGAMATRSPDERRRPRDGVGARPEGWRWVLNATFFSR